MKSKLCAVCNRTFIKGPTRGATRWNTQRFCSPKCYGKTRRDLPLPESTRLKLAKYHREYPLAPWKGKHLSESHRNNLRIAQVRRKEQFGYINSPEARLKLSTAMTGSNNHRWGTIASEQTREKMSQSRSGAKNHLWKGGISFEPYSLDWTAALRRQIRKRDNHTCQMCWASENKRVFDVHHIDYNKKNCAPTNLVTLCHSCHTKTNSNRAYWQYFCRTQFITYA